MICLRMLTKLPHNYMTGRGEVRGREEEWEERREGGREEAREREQRRGRDRREGPPILT